MEENTVVRVGEEVVNAVQEAPIADVPKVLEEVPTMVAKTGKSMKALEVVFGVGVAIGVGYGLAKKATKVFKDKFGKRKMTEIKQPESEDISVDNVAPTADGELTGEEPSGISE